MDRIKVHVVRYANAANLILRYKDPLTGKYVRKTSGTGNRKEARKAAGVWQDELNTGKARGRFAITWEQFRLRYEEEVLPGLAPKTGNRASDVFNVLERTLPHVKDGLLRDVTAERLSVLQADLRKRGRAEATIASHLAHLRAALHWAVDQGLLPELPKIRKPKRAKRSGRSDPMKGRPITSEEFERMLGKVAAGLAPMPAKSRRKPDAERKRRPYVVKPKPAAPMSPEAVESWKHFLRGLWWSGLRLGEALNLYWDRPDKLCVDLTGKRPMLRIVAELEKGGRDRLLPMAPEFADFLLQTPEAERHGRVFKPLGRAGNVLSDFTCVCRIISKIGKAAGVKVASKTTIDPKTGERIEAVKYASAHDCRRAFAVRWSTRVMPQVLMELMRHESIETTQRYYIGRNANSTADTVWEAYRRSQEGTVLGTVGISDTLPTMPTVDATIDAARNF